MPTRLLRDGILDSERMAQLSWAEEVFYRRLMSVVDDYGRYSATPMRLRSSCYPVQLDEVTDADIGNWLRAIEKAALVMVYSGPDGKKYLQLQDFRQQVRAKSSKYPAADKHSVATCVAEAQQVQTLAHLDVDVDVDGGVVEAAPTPPRQRGKPTKHPLPADFEISERVRQWALDKGFGKLDAHLESFRGKAVANGYTYANWDEAFMGAVRDDWAKLRVTTLEGSPRQRVDL